VSLNITAALIALFVIKPMRHALMLKTHPTTAVSLEATKAA